MSPVQKTVLSLREIREADRPETGGKGAGLARLASLDLPVPPAFVVTASFFEAVRSRFPDEPEVEALAHRLPAVLRDAVESALDALGEAPAGYAVRSSAAEEDSAGASFAGVHESRLRVPRQEVAPALFQCWASAFAERALQYRRRMGLPLDTSDIRMGAVVQVMLRPGAAGVLFTREPGAAGDDILINAVAGSGEDLGRGKVRPVSLRLPRAGDGPPVEVPPGIPLSERTLRDLVRMALEAEAAWGVPLDLEWAVEGDRVSLLQARPITAGAPAFGIAGDGEEKLPPTEDTLWTRANLRELLPDLPSPLFLSMIERADWREAYRRCGLRLPAGSEMVRIIEGRPYFNLSLIGAMLEALGLSLRRFARSIGHGEDIAGLPETAGGPGRIFLRHPVRFARLVLRNLGPPGEAEGFFDEVQARLCRLREEDPAIVPDARLAGLFVELERYNHEFLYALIRGLNRVSSKMFHVEILFPAGADPDRFINAVVGTGEKNVSVRQGLDLLRLAQLARSEGRVVRYLAEGRKEHRDYEEALDGTRFLPAFREYLATYGHRGVQETDPAMPLHREAPWILLKTIAAAAADPLGADPGTLRRRQERVAAAAWEGLRRGLSPPERILPLRIALLRRAVRSLRDAMALRERIRFEGMRVNAEGRRFLREAGDRLQGRGLLEEPGEIFLLRLEEVEAVLAGRDEGRGLRDRVRLRREERRRQEEIPMPNFLRESEIPEIRKRSPRAYREEGTFRGLPVGPGRVEGRVAVLEGPHQVDRVRPGDILVAPTLDPSWIPLFTLASGLVVEMGGTLSHGSIIAREYGLPTVVNLPGITRALKSGDRILLDGSTGLVRRLEG